MAKLEEEAALLRAVSEESTTRLERFREVRSVHSRVQSTTLLICRISPTEQNQKQS